MIMEYKGLDFVAIDFETASGRRDSVCEAGICVVRDGQIRETRSWLVRPRGNFYSNFNIQIHGIRPEDTENSPAFPFVWDELSAYLAETPVLVAHNAAFDMSCIRSSLGQYGLPKPDVTYYCSLRAARHLYDFSCNKLDYLCAKFEIPMGAHHRAGDDAEMCARLFLREVRDAGWCELHEMDYCAGRL